MNTPPFIARKSGTLAQIFFVAALSFGAGMTILVVAWRAKKLFEISVARGERFIYWTLNLTLIAMIAKLLWDA